MKNVDVTGKMKDQVTLCKLAEALSILREACLMHKTCISCPLYDEKKEQTACLICKTAYGSLSETISEAFGEIREPKQTNGDRIRSMTDEELAEFFYLHLQVHATIVFFLVESLNHAGWVRLAQRIFKRRG